MIDVRQAVDSVRGYFSNIQDLVGGQTDTIRLEEIELTDDNKYWLITLSFDYNSQTPDIFGNTRREKTYKIFKVNRETSQVEAMKIREV